MTSPVKRLWLVEIDDANWDYDRFQSAVVWATSADAAERQVRRAARNEYDLWIEDPEWKLNVTPAPRSGIALIHWTAG